MIKLLGNLPRKFYLAVSGGVDSMVAYDFLKNNHDITPIFFDHGTKDSERALKFLKEFFKNEESCGTCDSLVVGHVVAEKQKNESLEEYWRNERNGFFSGVKRVTRNIPIVTAHHLDDVIETWMFSSLHGQPKLIQRDNGLVTRPFLLTRKKELEEWADRKKVPYIEDLSNKDTSRMRNYIRHEMMPHVLKVNPGIHKLLAKKLKDKYDIW